MGSRTRKHRSWGCSGFLCFIVIDIPIAHERHVANFYQRKCLANNNTIEL